MIAGEERRRIAPWEWASLIVAAVVSVVIRLPVLTHPGLILGWNSDAALIGLIGRAMRSGSDYPVYFWGQHYLGTFTPMTTALAGLFIEHELLALRIAALVEMGLGALFFWLALRRIFQPVAAMIALLWLAAGPVFLFETTLAPVGAEQLLLVAGVLFWYATRASLQTNREWFVMGLIAGFGAWVHQAIVFVALGIAIGVIATQRLRARFIAVLAIGFAIGFAPHVLLLLRDDPVLYARVINYWNVVRVAQNLGATIRGDLWLLLADATAIGIVTGVCVILFAVIGLRAAPRGRAKITIIATIVASFAFWIFSTYPYPGAVRYIAPVVPLVYCAAAAGLLRLRRALAISAAIVIAAGLYVPRFLQANDVAAGRSERYTDWPGDFDPRPTLAALKSGGYRVCYGEVWVAHKLEWISSPTVRFVPVRSVHRTLNQSLTLIRQPGRKCFVDNDGRVTALSASEEAHWAAAVVERARKADLLTRSHADRRTRLQTWR